MNEIQAIIKEFEGNKVQMISIDEQLLFELYSTVVHGVQRYLTGD